MEGMVLSGHLSCRVSTPRLLSGCTRAFASTTVPRPSDSLDGENALPDEKKTDAMPRNPESSSNVAEYPSMYSSTRNHVKIPVELSCAVLKSRMDKLCLQLDAQRDG